MSDDEDSSIGRDASLPAPAPGASSDALSMILEDDSEGDKEQSLLLVATCVATTAEVSVLLGEACVERLCC